MTMVPASKLSKPHLIFYGGCGGGSEVMSRFGDGGGGGGYNDINGNNASSTTTATDNIITNTTTAASIIGAKHDDDDNNNVIRCVLGSDLGIGHPNNNNIIAMAEEDEQLQHQQQQQRQQQSRHSNNSSVNNDDDGGDIRQPVTSIKMADTYMIDSSSWLQLGLGGGGGGSGTHLDAPLQPLQQPESTAARSGGLMLELNLGGGGGGQQTTPFLMPEIEPRVVPQPPHEGGSVISGGSTATFISPHHHHHLLISSLSQQQSQLYFLQQQQQQQQIGWGFVNQRTALSTTAVAAGCCSSSMSPSSSSSLQPPVFLPVQGGVAPFLTRPFTPSGSSVDPDYEFRRIHPPPRRPHSGIWFALHASLHQSKEPFLPQLPKNFLRIKDGRMTVRLVMKYVANKLGLDCESEVEIRCRGQQLVPYLTLQHVRDNIWSPREAVTVTLLPDSSTSDHVMVLNYGRSTSSSAYFSY